jgi:hypothetical protein
LLGARNNIPAVYQQSVFASDGGWLSYGANYVDIWAPRTMTIFSSNWSLVRRDRDFGSYFVVSMQCLVRRAPTWGAPGTLLPYAAAIRSSVTSRRML